MKMVIQLDDVVLAKAMQLANQNGYELSQLIEGALRDRIEPTSETLTTSVLRLTTCGGTGLLPGVDLDNSVSLLTAMEPENDPTGR